ncbi:hypothetical protein [Halobacteriovorax sp. JY17]|uniref:hypothetical protein n=1 Tax=Halobacteriovorax sp. JY17 TaxID=2014617 RepID=UPI0025C51CE3|nr:hypothetical protein [Halobacteriovorax sp. JY17]
MNDRAAKKNLISDSLNFEQYQELSHDLVLRNDTSGVSYLESQLINITELREDSVCITLPKNICQSGHNLTLAIFLGRLKKKLQKFPPPESIESITLIGKVIDLSQVDEDQVLIEVKFSQYKTNEWKSIITKYIEQQDKITSLVEEVKK